MIETIEGLASTRRIETAASRMRRGKAARADVPRAAHGVFAPVERDHLALIEAENTGRIEQLLPLRRERMSASPFTFYRGTAGLMAHDLASQAMTGVHLVIDGDAHLSNFGLYASPERRLVFDLNDFDEAAPGPWEWDVKRLVTSVVLGGREIGLGRGAIRDAAIGCAGNYRMALRYLVSLDPLSRFYTSIDLESARDRFDDIGREMFVNAAQQASRRTSAQVIEQMTTTDAGGRLRFREDPPVLAHVPDTIQIEVEELMRQYRKTVRADVAMLLSNHALTDIVHRVVGVGSVGTRCFLVALTGPAGDHLVLQIKEASRSVVTEHLDPAAMTLVTLPPDTPEGRRVMVHQQVLQAVSDPFLGHLQAAGDDFYVRQFRDMKGSIDIVGMRRGQFRRYVAGCAWLLARAHSQSPDAYWVAGYLGRSDVFDRAVVDWAFAYAEQVDADYRAFIA